MAMIFWVATFAKIAIAARYLRWDFVIGDKNKNAFPSTRLCSFDYIVRQETSCPEVNTSSLQQPIIVKSLVNF